MGTDEPRFAKLRHGITEAVHIRDCSLMQRMSHGEGPIDGFAVCLGEGRCMIKAGGEKSACPFCFQLQLDHRSHERIDDIVKQVIRGN